MKLKLAVIYCYTERYGSSYLSSCLYKCKELHYI